jgi:hypothetical protein
VKSNKELLNELNMYLDKLGIKKGSFLYPVLDKTTGEQKSELRNYRKKIVKLFKDFSYERKLSELDAFRSKLNEMENSKNDSNE